MSLRDDVRAGVETLLDDDPAHLAAVLLAASQAHVRGDQAGKDRVRDHVAREGCLARGRR